MDPNYYGTTDDGTDVYIDGNGNYTDENGTSLTLPPNTTLNLQGGGTATASGTNGTGTASAPIIAGGSSGTGLAASSNTSYLSGLSNVLAGVAKIVNPTTTVNPATGMPYTQAQLNALAAGSSTSVFGANLGSLLPILLIGGIAYLVVKHLK